MQATTRPRTLGRRGWLMLAGLLCSTAVLADRFDELNVRSWKTADGEAFFPETDDPRVSVDWLRSRPSFGIAFSGGGTRSAAASLGQLRALTRLGWIDRARYLSANSGGSWTLLPYTYLDAELDQARFLGPYLPPADISDQRLAPETGNDADRGAMSAAIYRSKLIKRLTSVGRGDEAYADAIGKIFLKPFGLHDRGKLFTFHQKALQSALQANPDLRSEDFFRVTRERPYLLITGTLRVPLDRGGDDSELFLLEATPLYTGIRGEFRVPSGEDSGARQLLIGGGYVESFGYDSYEPRGRVPENGLWSVRLKGRFRRHDPPVNKRYRFNLSDVIGMSGAAPAIRGADMGLHLGLFPGFRHWAIDREKVLDDPELLNQARELKHGDGGDTDNLAVMPLLARQVENLLVLVNTRHGFPEQADCDRISTDMLVDDLISLFRPTAKLPHNQVLADPDGSRLRTLCEAFAQRKQQGEPLVYCSDYGIRDNRRQAISGSGYRPTICWVYLDRVASWMAQLSADGGEKTRDLIDGKGDFDRFPHYRTFAEKGGQLIDLNRERVHALSNLTAWTLLAAQEYLAEQLSAADLPVNRAPVD